MSKSRWFSVLVLTLIAVGNLTVAVAARLSPAQVAGYAGQPHAARHTGAARLHASGITGRGVTIEFLDTGIWANNGVATNTAGSPAILQGFVKPDIVAPGGHVTGPMNKTNTIPKRYLQFHDNDKFFMMSGTSQAAAVVSGTIALMLQANPSLTLNHVKCKLMNASRPAVDGAGRVAYSVFQQGAGQLNAVDAVSNPNFNCANVGLNVSADLAGTQRFGGPASGGGRLVLRRRCQRPAHQPAGLSLERRQRLEQRRSLQRELRALDGVGQRHQQLGRAGVSMLGLLPPVVD